MDKTDLQRKLHVGKSCRLQATQENSYLRPSIRRTRAPMQQRSTRLYRCVHKNHNIILYSAQQRRLLAHCNKYMYMQVTL